ncbi:hypothetical protein AAHH78_37840, partial [Burkholderia pseudomallei]
IGRLRQGVVGGGLRVLREVEVVAFVGVVVGVQLAVGVLLLLLVVGGIYLLYNLFWIFLSW